MEAKPREPPAVPELLWPKLVEGSKTFAGYGYGYRDGYGDGYGYGNGNGYGDGYGHREGNGDGYI